MLEIRPLAELNEAALRRIITGYISHEKYTVSYASNEHSTTFSLQLVELEQPYVKQYDPGEEIEVSQKALQAGWSIGAFDGEELVAIAIAEPQSWNNTLWIWEFHVAEPYRGEGIGRQMMERLAERAASAGLRTLRVETQTTNVPAIRFYRKAGFAIEGIDLSLYTNQDYPDGEMAVFMKRRL